MDYYGADRKLSELGEQDLEDFLEQDMFTPPANDPSMDTFGLVDTCDDSSEMDSKWLDNFFDDPVLNDRMMTEALQPRRVQSEHSYSLTNGETITVDGQIKLEVTEKDVEGDLLTSAINPNMTLTSATTSTVQTTFLDTTMTPVSIKQEPAGYNQHEITMATNSIATSQPTLVSNSNTRISSTLQHPGHSHPQTLLKQPTIILATSQHSPMEGDNLAQSIVTTAAYKQERYVLPKVNIKLEPCDSASDSSSPEHTTMYDSIGLPPTPPSSSNSDSEGSHSPQRSAPPSPMRHSQLLRQAAHTQHTLGGASAALAQPLFTSPIPTSGVLMLSEEEKRTLIAEGYPIPNKLPLTKQEEKNLKKIRRKIKNKISAQESRRKKKEYLETLEKKVEAYNSENSDLRKKLEQLENSNRSLIGQLQKLQALVAKVPRPPTPSSTQTGTCLMVLVLFFAVFLGTWSPLTWSIGYNMSPSSSALSSPGAVRGPSAGPQTLGVVMTTGSAGGGQQIGPEVQEPMSDSYATPNMRSRVLLSLRDDNEEQFGPHTPVTYKSLFSGWFSGDLCPGADVAASDYTISAPVPDVARQLPDDAIVTGNPSPQVPQPHGSVMHSYTAKVMAAPQPQRINTTA